MESKDRKTNRWLLGLVGLLAVMVVVQAYFLLSESQLVREQIASQPTLSATEQPPSAPEFPLEPTDNLLTQMEQIKEDFDQMFDESMQRFYSNPELEELFHRSSLYPQRVKIEENEDQYVMTLDIPIAENSEVQATVEDNILKVSGKVERVTEEREGDRVIRRETTARNFKQAIALPGPAKTDEVQTRYEEGTLTVIVPKPLDSEERDEA